MSAELENFAKDIHPLSVFKSIDSIESSGVYAIWWNDSISVLRALNRQIHFQGKVVTINERKGDNTLGQYHIHESEWNWNLENSPVCLYVGKASNIATRIKQHLELRIPSIDWYSPFKIRRQREWQPKTPDISTHFLIKRTSSCQLRAGIEHLFKNEPASDIRDKVEHFGISFYPETDFINRFYLEDLAIGYYRPWFNLDSER